MTDSAKTVSSFSGRGAAAWLSRRSVGHTPKFRELIIRCAFGGNGATGLRSIAGGDNYNEPVSAAQTVVINTVGTTTTLTGSATISAGSSGAYKVVVARPNLPGVATGKVTLSFGTTVVGSGSVSAGGSPILYTAALLGQMTLTSEEAAKAAAIFGLTKDEAAWFELSPERGATSIMPPTDPLIYRFYELI